jgi:hypothetical protein
MTMHWNSPVEGITMTLGLAYWVLMLVWLVFFMLNHIGMVTGVWVNTLFLFVLFALLGWQVFGAPLRR